MFSKPIRPFHNFDDTAIENVVIANPMRAALIQKSQNHNTSANLEKCKQSDLKEIIRDYKTRITFRQTSAYTHRRCSAKDIRKIKLLYDFALSGSKQILLDRVSVIYKMEAASTSIQRHFRGYIIRETLKLRGPALKDRSLCVNETDFYSLEPIKNIHIDEFFSYKGEQNFIYGFDFDSIITLFKNKQRANSIMNPYNRESMDCVRPTIEKLMRFSRLSKTDRVQFEARPPVPTNQRLVYGITDLSGNALRNQNANLDPLYDVNEMIVKMREIRALPAQRRIENVFMEIDQLGNYAQSTWFSLLNRRDCIRFFRSLYDIWYYRAQIPFDTKRKICPLNDPFISNLNEPIRYNDISEDNIKILCLNVMEDMICTGIDVEFRTLGAFHVLCGLTMVSIEARNAMPWLYESLVY
jgi:hypothetical protein